MSDPIILSPVQGDNLQVAIDAADASKPLVVRLATAGGPITAATNATPIVITAAGHQLQTGLTTWVLGVGGNTAANGHWAVTVIDANTFSLNGSAGNGAYTSGGQWLGDGYPLDAPFWFSRSNVTLDEAVPGTKPTIYARSGGSRTWPRIMIGPRPTVPVGLAVSMSGILDSSASGKTGVRLAPMQRVQWQDGFMALHQYRSEPNPTTDAWTGVRQLTISFAATFHTAQTNGQNLLGLKVDSGALVGAPLVIMSSLHINKYSLQLSFADGTDLTAFFPSGSYLSGTQRVTLQFDLDAGTLTAAVNGTWVTVTLSGTGSNFTGKSLLENTDAPFCAWGDADITLCGLSIQSHLVYQNTGVGTSQLRVDTGLADNDLKRFFTDGSRLAGDPILYSNSVAQTGAWVSANGEFGLGDYGYFSSNEENNAANAVANITLNNLTILGGNLGRTLQFGAVTSAVTSRGLTIRSCEVSGGACGIGTTANATPSYLVQIIDTEVDGIDSCMSMRDVILEARGLKLGAGGRCLLRFFGVSGRVSVPLTFAPNDWCKAYLFYEGGDNPADFSIEMDVDDETNRALLGFIAPIVLTTKRAGKVDFRLLNRFDISTPGKAAIAVSGSGGTGGDCVLTLPARTSGTPGNIAVSQAGARWRVVAPTAGGNPGVR